MDELKQKLDAAVDLIQQLTNVVGEQQNSLELLNKKVDALMNNHVSIYHAHEC